MLVTQICSSHARRNMPLPTKYLEITLHHTPVRTTCVLPVQQLHPDSAWIRVLGVTTNDKKEIADQKEEEQSVSRKVAADTWLNAAET